MAVEGRGVIYLGHLPNGFEEKEMRSYFSQFGVTTRMKLCRSSRSGKSKGYGFVEFASEEVAEIVAESMQGYLMFDKLLQCKVVPYEKIHPSLFSKRPFRPSMRWKVGVLLHNKNRDPQKATRVAEKKRAKANAILKKLRSLGLNPPEPFVNDPEKQSERAVPTPEVESKTDFANTTKNDKPSENVKSRKRSSETQTSKTVIKKDDAVKSSKKLSAKSKTKQKKKKK